MTRKINKNILSVSELLDDMIESMAIMKRKLDNVLEIYKKDELLFKHKTKDIIAGLKENK